MGATQIVTITAQELEALIERAVTRALEALPQPAPDQRWLTTREVAELLGVHTRSVQHYVKRGMPARFLGPKTVRYERDAVLAWFRARNA